MARKRAKTDTKATKTVPKTKRAKKEKEPEVVEEVKVAEIEPDLKDEFKGVDEEETKEEPKEEVKEKVVEVPDPDPILRWKKLNGSLRLPNRIIKPNEIFLARRSDLPKAFMDNIMLLDETPVTATKKVVKTLVYSLSKRDDGFFNIVDSNGKVLNEKPLKESAAKVLLEDLQ